MNRDDIIRMAREAGMSEGLPAEDDLPAVWTPISTAELERFAALVAAAEREECAKVAAWILKMPENDVSSAIRARGKS